MGWAVLSTLLWGWRKEGTSITQIIEVRQDLAGRSLSDRGDLIFGDGWAEGCCSMSRVVRQITLGCGGADRSTACLAFLQHGLPNLVTVPGCQQLKHVVLNPNNLPRTCRTSLVHAARCGIHTVLTSLQNHCISRGVADLSLTRV
jgi:hypothetical protein